MRVQAAGAGALAALDFLPMCRRIPGGPLWQGPRDQMEYPAGETGLRHNPVLRPTATLTGGRPGPLQHAQRPFQAAGLVRLSKRRPAAPPPGLVARRWARAQSASGRLPQSAGARAVTSALSPHPVRVAFRQPRDGRTRCRAGHPRPPPVGLVGPTWAGWSVGRPPGWISLRAASVRPSVDQRLPPGRPAEEQPAPRALSPAAWPRRAARRGPAAGR